jgi:[ribosomal protein S5]-alanine N-acetyltransferase
LTARAPERLESARLAYERIGPEHAGDVGALALDPAVMRTLWPWPEPPSAAELQTRLDAAIDHWETHGFGMWALRDRATGEFVGRGGPQYTDTLGAPAVEVGWAIVPQRWGQGLATELALTSVDVGFGPLALAELVAYTLPDNIASRRVMEKAGFAYERYIVHVGLPHVLYRRDRC